MPADASIYSQLRPVQLPDPLESYGRMVSIKSLLDEGELRGLQRTQLQRSIDQDRALQDYFANATPDQMSAADFYQRAIGAGANPAAVMKMQETGLHLKKTQADLEKTRVETQAAQVKQVRDALASAVDDNDLAQVRELASRVYGPDSVKAMPASVSAPGFNDWRARKLMQADQLVERMYPKLAMTDEGGVVQPRNPYTGETAGAPIRKTLGPDATLRAQVTAATQDPFGMLGIQDLVRRATAPQPRPGYVTPAQLLRGGENAFNAAPAAAPAAVAPTAIQPPPEAGKGAPPIEIGQSVRDAMGRGLTGDEFLQALPPQLARQVKAYADGRMPFPGGFALKSPYFQTMMQMVGQYDPSFDAVNYNARNKTAVDFSPGGQSGKKMQAINQALHHAGQFYDAIEQLGNFNGIATPLNAPVNWVQKTFGDTRQGYLAEKGRALASELRKVYAGSSGGTLTELLHWADSFDPNASEQQQKKYLQGAIELLQGAIDSQKESYERGMGARGDFNKFISPGAQKSLQKITGGAYSSDGNGAAPAQTDSGKIAQPATKTVSALPDPAGHAGWTATGDDGTVYVSDGKSWVRKAK